MKWRKQCIIHWYLCNYDSTFSESETQSSKMLLTANGNKISLKIFHQLARCKNFLFVPIWVKIPRTVFSIFLRYIAKWEINLFYLRRKSRGKTLNCISGSKWKMSFSLLLFPSLMQFGFSEKWIFRSEKGKNHWVAVQGVEDASKKIPLSSLMDKVSSLFLLSLIKGENFVMCCARRMPKREASSHESKHKDDGERW